MPQSSKYIIIGAGIVGSAIAKELAQKGEEVLVLEARKISSQTSKSSSKMLHGGIRYLENLDFKLVFEALREKNHWAQEKPHLVKEAPFYLPTYTDSKYPLWAMRLGIFLYDLLSLFRNKNYKNLSRSSFLKQFSSFKAQGFKGASVYSDAVIDDERFTIEIAEEAQKLGAKFLEDHESQNIKFEAGSYIINCKNGESFQCEKLILACGPFTDLVAKQAFPAWQDIILPSKGIHLWLKKDCLSLAGNIVLQTKDNRIIFLINHEDAILAGTTESVLTAGGVKLDLTATREEVDYLLQNINSYMGERKVTRDDIQSTFAGIRPLVKEKGKNSKKTSREHKIFSPQKNLYIICGGKYTTFRVMAKDLVDKL